MLLSFLKIEYGVFSSDCRLGDRLGDFCRQATREIVLIAPFIKARALDRILEFLGADVNLLCVTRWLPSEIASGASDLEVFEIVRDHHGSLRLRQNLHAKYYRSDGHVLIGSANLTNSALGWTSDPNLEILIPVDNTTRDITEFEKYVLSGAIEVDLELYESMVAASENWPNLDIEYTLGDTVDLSDRPESLGIWIPASRFPTSLYKVYQNMNSDDLPKLTREAGLRDLSVLQPPSGLDEELFNQTIGVSLLTMPVFDLIDHQVVTSQRFGAMRDLIKQKCNFTNDEATRAWQTLIRWIRHFLPDRYEYTRPKHSERITKITT